MFKTYCRALIDSFFNPRVYRDAISAWQGFGGFYIVLLAAITALMLFASFMVTLQNFDAKQLEPLMDKLPTIVIEQGLISVDAPEPVVITDDKVDFTITIDTTKSESELRDTGTEIGIGRNFLFVNYNGQYEKINTDSLRDTSFIINKETLRNAWDNNMPVVKAVAYPLMWLGQFVNLMIACAIVAFLSYFLTTFMREEFDFLTRMRLAALALTPASIISMFLKLSMAHQTAPWFGILLAMLYLYVMLILMRRLPAQDDDVIAA